MKQFYLTLCLCVTGLLMNVSKGLSRSFAWNTTHNIEVVKQFPFLNNIIHFRESNCDILLAPTTVRWPSGTMQVNPNISCLTSESLTVNVEVFLGGITDADPMSPGNNIACVVHIGEVTAFGSNPCDLNTFNCIRNYNMDYAGMDNAGYDVFTANISDLPPGNYEYTCACADNGVIVDPLTHPVANIRWIGDELCPATNAFINGRITVGGAAINDDCNGTMDVLGAGDNFLNNLCTEDGLLGFGYTITNGEVFDVSISPGTLLNPVINEVRINDPCSGTLISLPATCLPVGTQVYIEAGYNSACPEYGTFTINVSESDNGVVNETCDEAIDLVLNNGLCETPPNDFIGDNTGACPELSSLNFDGCTFDDGPGVWFEFFTDLNAELIDIEVTGLNTDIGLFSGACPGIPVAGGCGSAGILTDVAISGNTTYYLLVAGDGGLEGPFNILITEKSNPPANDDPCAPEVSSDYNVPTNGTALNGTTLCAGGDPAFPDCPASDQENVVFFEVTIPAGNRGINVQVNPRNDNMTPIPGGSSVVIGIMDDACGGSTYEEATCLVVGGNYDFLCLEPGTYNLQVSTSSANAGDFLLRVQLIAFSGNCSMGEENDFCLDARDISSGGVFCSPIRFTGCTQEACTESFSYGADCPFDIMPTVWFKYTVEPDVGTIDITDLVSSDGILFMAVFEDNGCMIPPTAITPCITANTTSINVIAGNTYYIAVGTNSPTMSGSNFRFDIQFNKLPINDDPDVNSPRPPLDLSGSGSHTGTTCCAIGVADDPNLDLPNLGCGTATHDDAVWYRYTVATEKSLQVRVFPGGMNPISGNITVEVMTGSTTSPGGLITPTSFHCAGLPATVRVGCLEPGTEIWIKVATTDQDCGSFIISVSEPVICDYAESCEDITDVQTFETAATDLECGAFILKGINGCLDLACPEEDPRDCGAGDSPTVWVQINTDMDADQLFTFVNTPGSWQPVWAIYSGPCDNLTLINGGTDTNPIPCSNGDSNPDAHNIAVPIGPDGLPVRTFYVAINAQGVVDNPNFTITAFTQAGCVSCIGNDACEPEATFTVINRSSDRPLDDMVFCQGEEVTVCIQFYYDASETDKEWFHGLFPDFGNGWDMDAFDPTSVITSPPGAEWLGPDDGSCAPYMRELMPLLCTYYDANGTLRLCNIKCGFCPCSPPLTLGSLLPYGWFWNSDGGAGPECLNECAPYTRYGVPDSEDGLDVTICMNLRTRVFDDLTMCEEDKSLRISFVTTSDGVTGCWDDPIAECKLDVAQVGPDWEIDCTPPILVDYDDTELCNNGTLNSEFNTADGSATPITIEPIPNVNVSGMNPHFFPSGSGTVTDMLENLTTSVQVAEYIVWAQDPSQLCPGPKDTFRVTLYPDLLVLFNQLYVCHGLCLDVVPLLSGGTGNYVEYIWNTGENTAGINVCPTATTTYFVTVTDDLGCSGVGSVQVEKKIPVSFTINPGYIEICQDDVIENIDLTISDIVANGAYGVTWDIPAGLDGAPVGDGFVIFDEASVPREEAYILCATLTDQFGCKGETCIEVDVKLTPIVELLPNPLPSCGANTVDLVVDYVAIDIDNPAAWFYLYNCDDELIDQVYSNTGPDFTGITLPVGASEYCFRIVVVDDQSGCQNSDELIIPSTQGTDVLVSPNVSICSGSSTTLQVLNASSFASFLWTPGGSTDPDISVSPTSTTQYSVVATDSNGCTSEKAIVVTVNPLPVANISGSLSFCPGGNTTLNASTGSSWLWSTPTNSSLATTRTLGPINTPDTYTVVVTDVNGCTGSATVTVVEDANLNVTIPTLALCDNNVDSLDAGAGFTVYEWRDLSGNLLGTAQKLEVTMAGSYVISVSDGMCSGLDTVLVINNTTPVLDLDTVQVCRLNTGLGPTNLDFTSFQNGLPGQWFNSDLAPVDVTNWANVSFLTVGSRDTFTFTFITSNALAPCNNITVEMEVVVRNCACPAVAVNAPPVLCNSTLGTNSTNLNALRLHSNTGTWTVVSGPTPAPVITAGLLNGAGAAAGVHRLRFTLNPLPGGNCPDSAEVDITIQSAPIAITMDTVLCNEVGGTRPSGIDLNALLTTNSAMGGTWTQTGGTGVGGTIPNISVLGMNPELLTFSYTTNTAVAPCAQITVPVEVRIRDCTCPDVVLLPDTLCNGSMTLLDLQDPDKFFTDPIGIAGTWTINSPATISAGNFLNPFGLTANDYTATFTISGSLPPNCQRTFDKTVVIRNQTVVQSVGSPCSEDTGQGVTTVNLFSLLRSGFTSGGSWVQVSPAAPLLTIPANGVVDFNGIAIGTQFVFRYIVNASKPCTPVDVIVDVRDCDCPPIIVNPAPPLCNNGGVSNGMLDLNTLLDSQTAPGVWTVTYQGNPVLLSGTVLDVNGQPAGNYSATYTLVPAPGGNCTRSRLIIIEVKNFVTATIMDGEVCNAAGSGNTTILDLNSLVVGTLPSNGQWLDPNRVPISGAPNIDFNGIAPGFVTYYFLIDNADPCTDIEIPVAIEIKDCGCPSFTISMPMDVCNNGGRLDLKTLEIDVPTPGTWSVFNSGGLVIPISGTILNLLDLPVGQYTLTYIVTTPQPGCPADKSVQLNVFAPKNAGIGSTASFCTGVSDLVTLNSLLSGQDAGGVWTSNQTAGFNATNGTFSLSGIQPGLYMFTYSFTNQAPCPNSNAEVFIRVNNLPIADAGLDKSIDCSVRTAQLGGNSSTGAIIQYSWSLNGNVIGNTATITANSGGDYTLEVTNTETGCKSTDLVQVVQADELPTFDVDSSNVICFNESNGFIQIINLQGGTPPYQYSFDGGVTFGSVDRIDNLNPGTYVVQVKESNGCINEVTVDITQPEPLEVVLGDDIRINLGDSVKIEILSVIPGSVTRIEWTANGQNIFVGQNLTSFINANQTVETIYTVSIYDTNGCSATADITVNINKIRLLQVPNILHTQSNKGNHNFVVQSPDLDKILTFKIYDRWGNLIYAAENIDPVNDVDKFWNGTFSGKPVEQGVYVYVLDVLFKDGLLETRSGDVTVLSD